MKATNDILSIRAGDKNRKKSPWKKIFCSVFISVSISYPTTYDIFFRSDCFGSEYFMSCMDSLLTTSEAKMHHSSLVDDIHEYLKK